MTEPSPAQKSSQPGQEMASVKLEDCSQTLELNVIVKKEEEEDERRTEEENGGVEQEREDGNIDSDMEEEEDQEGGGVANAGNKYTSQGID
ncbi:major centromere autoantigen B-like isoform X2 [Oncorhynchus mykiss]|uniref:major centromere autoantigen B-like isoform X2 n=1 Tax=Oncorhynchus mykiss TaxID=8022 RepID=UPI001877FD8B|nr:major centromere autoantigen B-like isoform X2 [Oncorhynchus mykiss]